MNNYRFVLIILISLTVLSGCSPLVLPTTTTHLGSKRVFYKNYTLGQKQAAFVGQPLITVKDYMVDSYKDDYMVATDNFVIKGGVITINGDKNTKYRIMGETTIGQETFTVVSLPKSQLDTWGILVDENGRVYHKVLNGGVLMFYSFQASPSNVRFVASKKENINVEGGYINYELIYSGTDGKSITITYREYTSNDLARPAFYQNLVYESEDKEIRFRNTKFLIHEATNEKIIYTVISDSLPK